MARVTRAAAAAARPSLDALDDALLLHIIGVMISDDGFDAVHDAEEAWHPTHLASLACVSRCASRRRRCTDAPLAPCALVVMISARKR
jgi:hypothetical protein